MSMDLSRRDFLRAAATAGAATTVGGFGALEGVERIAEAAASRAYSGKLRVVSIAASTPGRGYNKLLDEWQKKHPGISVDYLSFPSDRFVALFTAAQRSGEQIDLLILNGQDVRRYALSHTLLPLDNVSYKNRVANIGLKTYKIHNHLWALPSGGMGGFPIWVNKALLDKAHVSMPRTWSDLLKVSAALKKQGISTFTHDGKVIYLWPVWFFTTYAQTTHNRSVEKTFATLSGKGKFTDPEVVDALDLIFSFTKRGLFSPDVLSLDTAGAEAEFMTGRAAFWLHYDGIIADVRQQKPPNMDLRVQLMPRLVNSPSVKSQFPGGVGSALAIYSKIAPQRKAAAYDLLNFLTSNPSDTYLAQDGHSPVTTNVHAKGSSDPVALAEKQLIHNMTIYLDWYWPPEITSAFQEQIQAGIAGKATASQAAKNIQSVFAGLVSKGYKFGQ